MEPNACSIVLLVSLGIASHCDLKSRRIPNWLTYGATAVQLLFCAIGLGADLPLAVAGFAACFGAMFLGYLFCGVGAGDVKLAGVMGAGLGVRFGLDAILWAHVFGAIFCAGYVLYSTGPRWLLCRTIAVFMPRCHLKEINSDPFQYPIPMAVFLGLGSGMTLLGIHLT